MPKVNNKTFNSNNPLYNACVGNNGDATASCREGPPLRSGGTPFQMKRCIL